jgi:hypothetical protein
VEALALAAFEVIYREPQPSNIEKVSLKSSIDLTITSIDNPVTGTNESLRGAEEDLTGLWHH